MNVKRVLMTLMSIGVMLVLPPTTAQNTGAEAEMTSPDAFVWLSQQGIGLILGGFGETRMSGEIYGLGKLEDFAGTYSETTAGLSAIVGGGGVWLENKKGVKMHLKAESTGVGINLSVGTVVIKLGMVD